MYYNQLDRLDITSKGRNDFVSQADIEAERAILEVLTRAYPDHGILAEESGMKEGGEYTWVIDPWTERLTSYMGSLYFVFPLPS